MTKVDTASVNPPAPEQADAGDGRVAPPATPTRAAAVEVAAPGAEGASLGKGSSSSAEGGERFSRDELVARVAVFSPALVEELHKTAQRQLDAEDRRENLLITKAGSLLGQSGLTITVAGAIVGLIVKEPALFDRLGVTWLVGLGISYLFVFGCGLAAAMYAMRVVLVRGDFEELDEKVVFDEGELLNADRPLALVQPAEQDDSTATTVNADSNATAVTRYRRWMIPHMWSIYQRHNAIHDEKAKLLKRGQVSFTMFVVGITLLVPLLTVALLSHPASKEPLSMSTSTSTTPVAPAPAATQSSPKTAEPVSPTQPRPIPTTVPPSGRRLQGSDPRPGTLKLRGK